MTFKRVEIAASLGVLLAGGAALVGAYADPVQDMEDCASIKVEEERLACFDAAYAQLQASGLTADSILESRVVRVKVPVPTASPAGGAIPQADSGQKNTGIFSGFGLPFGGAKKDQTAETFGQVPGRIERGKDGSIKELTAQVANVDENALGTVTLTLDNGQVWRQTDGRLRAKVGQSVRIKRGGMGGYFLSVDGGRSVRAIRVDDGNATAPTPSVSAPVAAVVETPKVAKPKKDKKGLFSRFGKPFSKKDKDAEETADDFGKSDTPTKEERDAAPKSMTERVASVLQDPMGNYIITLESGQVWQQTDGRITIRTGDSVTINKGALGGHFLQVDGEGRSIRVSRID